MWNPAKKDERGPEMRIERPIRAAQAGLTTFRTRATPSRWRPTAVSGVFRSLCCPVLLAAATLIESSLLALHLYDSPVPVVPFVLHFLVAFSGYGLAVLYLLRRSASTASQGSLPLILVAGLAFRLTLFAAPPIWDDDLYRYLWDGRVGLQGVNPYLHAPDAPELEDLQDDTYDLVSFKQIRTIYPPLFQWLFQFSQWAAPSSMLFLKTLSVFFEAALIALLLSLLKSLRYPTACILVYAWNPLPIKEYANSGHMDSLVLLLLFLALRWLLAGRMTLAHAALGLSVLGKVFTGIALPFFLLMALRKSPKTLLCCFGVFCLVLLLSYVPFISAGALLFDGLRVYSRYWNFNSGFFALIETGLQSAGWSSPRLARGLAAAGVVGVTAAMLWRLARRNNRHDAPAENPSALVWRSAGKHQASVVPASELAFAPGRVPGTLPPEGEPLLQAIFYSLAALVLLSPAVQPWYLCWLLPFILFFPKASWISLSGLGILSYLFYLHFTDLAWPRLLEFGIPTLLALWEYAGNELRGGWDLQRESLLKEPS